MAARNATMTADEQTAEIQKWLDRLRAGDDSARAELVNCAGRRLEWLTRKMLRNWERVHRWEQTADVMQNVLVRLYRALAETRPETPVEFFRLAALSVRRELRDLAKHYFGPRGEGTNHATPAWRAKATDKPMAWEFGDSDEDPVSLAAWTEFHARVACLPADEREVFDLLWYQGRSRAEAAEMMGISQCTLKRRWAAARLRLHQILGSTLAAERQVQSPMPSDPADSAR
jgi:RNA polymerase sigma-70 factor (ECF subfamily)